MPQELQELGLSEKEARVYLASLELGPTTAEKIATHAKVNRSTTYVQIESLMKLGLMSTYEEGKKTFFSPESPELLRRLLAKQQDAISLKDKHLAEFLPVLLRTFEGAGEKPVVRFFPGKDGISSVREEILTLRNKKMFLLFSPEHISKIYSEEYLDDYSKRRKAAGIHSKGIYVHKAYFNKAGIDSLTERRYLPPKILPLSIDMSIFDDKTAIFSLEGSLFALVIESKQIAASMKMIFEFLWNHAEEPSKKS